MKLTGAAMVSLALLLVPQTARTEPEPNEPEPNGETQTPSAETVAEARAHFLAGKKAHAAKEFVLAAENYLQAYKLYPQPLFLYNVAQVKRLAGDKAASLSYYQQYLDLEPNGRGAANTREIMVELRSQIAADKARVETESRNTVPEGELPDNVDASKPEITELPDTEAIAPIEMSENPRAGATSPGRTLKIASLSAAGIGILALGTSAYFATQASSKHDELAGFRGTWTSREQTIWDEGESADRWTVITAGVGAAAILSSVVLYAIGSSKASGAEKLTLLPTSTSESASITLRGSF